jgi:hypothetical protein
MRSNYTSKELNFFPSNSNMILCISKYSGTLKQFHSVILIAAVASASRLVAGKRGGWFLTFARTAANFLPDNLGLNNVSRTCTAFAGK